MVNKRRNKPNDTIRGAQAIKDLTYNEQGCMSKVSIPIMGQMKILGAIGSAVNVEIGALIAVFNNSAAPVFVAFGASGMAAPTTPANGIPIPPYQYVVLPAIPATDSTGVYIRASSADAYAYQMVDDAAWVPGNILT